MPARAVPTSQGVSCTVLLASAALSAVVGHRTYVDAFNTRGACCVREMHVSVVEMFTDTVLVKYTIS